MPSRPRVAMWTLPLGVVLLGGALAWPGGATAQQTGIPIPHAKVVSGHTGIPPADPDAAPAPFGPGERMEYKVKIGIFSVGEGSMRVESLDTVRGHMTYRASMAIKGGLGPADVDDITTTWFSVTDLVSYRFVQNLHEVNYRSFRHYELYPSEDLWERTDNDESGPLGSEMPLDDISFVYFIRTLPLEVGKTYTFDRYFKDEGNPVTIKVLRKAEREVPAGKFKTIVVQPIIKTAGLFGEGGNAELYFTDDDRRILVYMRSNIPHFPGSLTLHLKSYQPGLPLNPKSRAEVLERLVKKDSVPDGSGD